MRKTPCNLEKHKYFLGETKKQTMKCNINKTKLHQSPKACALWKTLLKKNRRNITQWKIPAKHAFDKELSSKISLQNFHNLLMKEKKQ